MNLAHVYPVGPGVVILQLRPHLKSQVLNILRDPCGEVLMS
jgi:hypothetical protein